MLLITSHQASNFGKIMPAGNSYISNMAFNLNALSPTRIEAVLPDLPSNHKILNVNMFELLLISNPVVLGTFHVCGTTYNTVFNRVSASPASPAVDVTAKTVTIEDTTTPTTNSEIHTITSSVKMILLDGMLQSDSGGAGIDCSSINFNHALDTPSCVLNITTFALQGQASIDDKSYITDTPIDTVAIYSSIGSGKALTLSGLADTATIKVGDPTTLASDQVAMSGLTFNAASSGSAIDYEVINTGSTAATQSIVVGENINKLNVIGTVTSGGIVTGCKADGKLTAVFNGADSGLILACTTAIQGAGLDITAPVASTSSHITAPTIAFSTTTAQTMSNVKELRMTTATSTNTTIDADNFPGITTINAYLKPTANTLTINNLADGGTFRVGNPTSTVGNAQVQMSNVAINAKTASSGVTYEVYNTGTGATQTATFGSNVAKVTATNTGCAAANQFIPTIQATSAGVALGCTAAIDGVGVNLSFASTTNNYLQAPTPAFTTTTAQTITSGKLNELRLTTAISGDTTIDLTKFGPDTLTVSAFLAPTSGTLTINNFLNSGNFRVGDPTSTVGNAQVSMNAVINAKDASSAITYTVYNTGAGATQTVTFDSNVAKVTATNTGCSAAGQLIATFQSTSAVGLILSCTSAISGLGLNLTLPNVSGNYLKAPTEALMTTTSQTATYLNELRLTTAASATGTVDISKFGGSINTVSIFAAPTAGTLTIDNIRDGSTIQIGDPDNIGAPVVMSNLALTLNNLDAFLETVTYSILANANGSANQTLTFTGGTLSKLIMPFSANHQSSTITVNTSASPGLLEISGGAAGQTITLAGDMTGGSSRILASSLTSNLVYDQSTDSKIYLLNCPIAADCNVTVRNANGASNFIVDANSSTTINLTVTIESVIEETSSYGSVILIVGPVGGSQSGTRTYNFKSTTANVITSITEVFDYTGTRLKLQTGVALGGVSGTSIKLGKGDGTATTAGAVSMVSGDCTSTGGVTMASGNNMILCTNAATSSLDTSKIKITSAPSGFDILVPVLWLTNPSASYQQINLVKISDGQTVGSGSATDIISLSSASDTSNVDASNLEFI